MNINYKDHKIKITEGEHDIKAEITIKGKEYGLVFDKKKKKEAIKMAKQTIDYLSAEESKVFEYKNSTIYIIKLKDKFIAKGLYKAYGSGELLLEESADTFQEVKKKIKKSFRDIEKLSNKIKERENEKSIHSKTKSKKRTKNS